jgi:hypothetical protein
MIKRRIHGSAYCRWQKTLSPLEADDLAEEFPVPLLHFFINARRLVMRFADKGDDERAAIMVDYRGESKSVIFAADISFSFAPAIFGLFENLISLIA